jgi:hypothetical protein
MSCCSHGSPLIWIKTNLHNAVIWINHHECHISIETTLFLLNGEINCSSYPTLVYSTTLHT